MAEIKVRTNGQTLRVNASVSHWTTAALAVTASGTNDVESTTTTTITSDYSMHFANTATTATITVKQLDGTTLVAQTFEVNPGVGLRILNPVPDNYQIATDAVSMARLALAPTGALAETVNRALAGSNSSVLSSGRMQMIALPLTAGTVVTTATFLAATTGAGTPTAQWFALYDSARVLLGQTADDTSTAWAANNTKTLTFAAPITTTYTGMHYLAICVAAATPPTLFSYGGAAITNGLTPVLAGFADTGLTTTAPATAAAITAAAAVPYAYVS